MTKAGIQKTSFGTTHDGTPVDLYVLTNEQGMAAKVITYGCIVTELHVPNRNGKLGDVVLGFDRLEGYLKGHPYFGAIVGRVANRIAKARFKLNGKEYSLTANDGPNALHGGLKGFDKVVWQAEPAKCQDGVAVKLSYVSPDGEEGYPGNLSVTTLYTLTDANEFRIDYEARTDADTPVNLTNHSFFNLAGAETGGILGHELRVPADQFTPVDDTRIPTGNIQSVAGTPLDFRKPAAIGTRLEQVGNQPSGYDVNYVINGGGGRLSLAAQVYEPTTGQGMDVLTTEPGVQLYTGNFLDGTLTGKRGVKYQQHHGFCLETQHFPDSINQPQFPSTILRPGQIYQSTTVYRFSVTRS